ncbi:MAG: dephospho-CoA kinase [Planctomycetaceae bacterium]|nr:dephospho-CoA kinase [Planctomycetaceae bacterium]
MIPSSHTAAPKPDLHPVSQPKPIIGLAGGIGSGKSLVARQLAGLGAAVVDADHIARQALDQPDVIRQLTDWWGTQILTPDRKIDRKKIADLVFADPDQRRRLESLIHPIVAEHRHRIVDQAQADSAVKAVIIDAPLLFEAGLDAICDAVIFVHADREIRLRRVAQERRWDAQELDRREISQMGLDFKRQQAHHVVDNDSDESNCLAQVRDVFSRILSRVSTPRSQNGLSGTG